MAARKQHIRRPRAGDTNMMLCGRVHVDEDAANDYHWIKVMDLDNGRFCKRCKRMYQDRENDR